MTSKLLVVTVMVELEVRPVNKYFRNYKLYNKRRFRLMPDKRKFHVFLNRLKDETPSDIGLIESIQKKFEEDIKRLTKNQVTAADMSRSSKRTILYQAVSAADLSPEKKDKNLSKGKKSKKALSSDPKLPLKVLSTLLL